MFVPRESDGDGRRNPTDQLAQESRRPLEAAFFILAKGSGVSPPPCKSPLWAGLRAS